jgi:hypothetical protein
MADVQNCGCYKLHCELDQLDGFFSVIITFCLKLPITSVRRRHRNISGNSYSIFIPCSHHYQIDCYGSHVDVSDFITILINSAAIRFVIL